VTSPFSASISQQSRQAAFQCLVQAVHAQFFHWEWRDESHEDPAPDKDRMDSHPDSLAVPVVLEDKTG
jgi:hypothetical protein